MHWPFLLGCPTVISNFGPPKLHHLFPQAYIPKLMIEIVIQSVIHVQTWRGSSSFTFSDWSPSAAKFYFIKSSQIHPPISVAPFFLEIMVITSYWLSLALSSASVHFPFCYKVVFLQFKYNHITHSLKSLQGFHHLQHNIQSPFAWIQGPSWCFLNFPHLPHPLSPNHCFSVVVYCDAWPSLEAWEYLLKMKMTAQPDQIRISGVMLKIAFYTFSP